MRTSAARPLHALCVYGKVSTATGSYEALFVYGPDARKPVMIKRGAVRTYVFRDGRNNVVTSNTIGGQNPGFRSYTMSVWGEGPTEDDSPHKYTSRRIDEESGLYYNHRGDHCYCDTPKGGARKRDLLGGKKEHEDAW